MKHKITLTLAAVFIGLFTLTLASALTYELLCLERGEKVEFSLCNPNMDDRTCASAGTCQYCTYISPNSGAHCPSTPSKCNARGLSCSSGGGGSGGGGLDIVPPTMTVSLPIQDSIHSDRSVLMDIETDETSTIYYKDNSNSRQTWTRLCLGCTDYNRARTFKEGLNDITFRATDRSGNSAETQVTFRVDSKAPKISKTSPNKGFASGQFHAELDELNPVSLTLTVSNSQTGTTTSSVDVNSCEYDGRKYQCETFMDLSAYNNQEIDYFFTLVDLAGSSVDSKTSTVSVDNSAPIINSFNHELNGKKLSLTLDITESNFEAVEYIDHSESKPRARKLCSSLKNNLCEKTVTFSKDGTHNVDIIVSDEAGNQALRSLSFVTDSKEPRISKTYPKSGFASGEFSAEVSEANLQSLTLYYGLSGSLRSHSVPLGSCSLNKGKHYCSTFVDLADFDGQEIEYYFKATDILGQEDESRLADLDVDVTFPQINSLTHTIDNRRVTITLDVTEENFDRITYIDNTDSRPRERTLCSSLRDNICEKRITFKEGPHNLLIQVKDDAGNIEARSLDFTV